MCSCVNVKNRTHVVEIFQAPMGQCFEMQQFDNICRSVKMLSEIGLATSNFGARQF